jgi:hypothetical protein
MHAQAQQEGSTSYRQWQRRPVFQGRRLIPSVANYTSAFIIVCTWMCGREVR